MPIASFLHPTYRIVILANITDEEKDKIISEFKFNFEIVKIGIKRKPAFISDTRALFELIKFFMLNRPRIVFSIMPKSGLLAMLASYFCLIPNRIHCFTGQVWATKLGIKKTIYRWIDKLIVKLSTKILVDGVGQKKFLVEENVASKNEIGIIWNGSIAGVDFNDIEVTDEEIKDLRAKMRFEPNDRVLLFMSRVTNEKGFQEIFSAFVYLRSISDNYKLLLIGPDEEDLIDKFAIGEMDGIYYLPYVMNVANYIKATDAFVSPSHREGLPMTLLTALALDARVFVSNVYGNTDLVENGLNGYVHPVKNWEVLAKQIHESFDGDYVCSITKTSDLILRDFDRTVFKKHFLNFINNL